MYLSDVNVLIESEFIHLFFIYLGM